MWPKSGGRGRRKWRSLYISEGEFNFHLELIEKGFVEEFVEKFGISRDGNALFDRTWQIGGREAFFY